MSKARLYLVLAVALVTSLAFAAPAFAWTHGQFSATTDACAGCHVAHAAQAPKLLKTGPTQTQFCFMCHGDGGVSAPYDVKDGRTVAGSAYPSTAGGFVRQWNGTTYVDVTSRHNVWGLVGESGYNINPGQKQFFVPGSPYQFGASTSGFVCGSCHNPHDGGTTPDPATGLVTGSSSTPNPRLLRRSITVGSATYSNLFVSFRFETVGTFTYGNPPVASGVYKVVEYKSGSTDWCGACHIKFNTRENSGHTADAWGMYRHAFNVDLYSGSVRNPNAPTDSSFSGTPLETPTNGTIGKIACLSCHRAHSTTATVAGWASSWPRSEGGTSSTSALLRMNNRGVCYNCHGAAQYNLP